ncbi:MAG: VWA domain-containing protein [Akkermansiaceae bacterium]
MMLLNVGESMNVADIQPIRLERIHLKIADFAKARDGLPLGLVAYAGSPHLVLLPTQDTGIVADMAIEISPEIMPRPGSDLSSALELAAGKLKETGGVIVAVLDTIVQDQSSELEAYRKGNGIPVEILAVAREGSTELESINKVASALGA